MRDRGAPDRAEVAAGDAARAEIVDRIAATVNDTAIPESEVRKAMVVSALSPESGESDEAFRARVIDALIDQHLEYEDAARFGPASPDAAQIEDALNRLRERLKAEGKDPAAEFAAAGLTPEEVRASLERQLVIARYLRERFAPIAFADEQQAREEYEKRYVPEQTAAGQPVGSVRQPRRGDAQARLGAGLRGGGRALAARAAAEVPRVDLPDPGEHSGRPHGGRALHSPSADQDARAVMPPTLLLGAWLALAGPAPTATPFPPAAVQRAVAVPMRDGVVLRADVLLPARSRPVSDADPPHALRPLPQRGGRGRGQGARARLRGGPAGRARALRLRRRVRPVRPRGRATATTRSSGPPRRPGRPATIGTFGLSYPAAVQWLAAVESPPHLKAMVPAMTFSSPRNFFYAGGAWDLSWISWIWDNIAPDARVKKELPGPRTGREASAAWKAKEGEILPFRLPLTDLPELRAEAPFYFDWLAHPPDDAFWDWAELRGRYGKVRAAVLNISGWHDEAYGPEGAMTNFLGLLAARQGEKDPRTRIILGPWVHGGSELRPRRTARLRTAGAARLPGGDPALHGPLRARDRQRRRRRAARARVRHGRERLALGGHAAAAGHAAALALPRGGRPARPRGPRGGRRRVVDGVRVGPRASRAQRLRGKGRAPTTTAASPRGGTSRSSRPSLWPSRCAWWAPVETEIFLSADAPDADLWVKLEDVAPDGTAWNLSSPGTDVLRVSLREGGEPKPLSSGEIAVLRLPNLRTGNSFAKGHRVRIVLCGSFMPDFSRNLQTGESETRSARLRRAAIRIRHDAEHASRILLPVVADAEGR